MLVALSNGSEITGVQNVTRTRMKVHAICVTFTSSRSLEVTHSREKSLFLLAGDTFCARVRPRLINPGRVLDARYEVTRFS